MTKLTQMTVDRIAPRAERFEVSDTIVAGLRLVVQPTGARSWVIRYRGPDRKTAKMTLGKASALDLKAARTLARKELAKVAGGEDPRERKRREALATLGAVVEQYDRHVIAKRRPRTQVEIRRHLTKAWQPLHGRPIAEVSRREVAARLLAIKDKSGDVAANRARASLSALFAWANKQGLADVNPVTGTAKNEERPRERVLGLEELREVWAATAEPGAYNAVVRLLLLTGQRKGEIGGLGWSEVDLDRAVLRLPSSRTKNRRPHVLPLPTQAVEIIKAQPEHGTYVFGAGGASAFSGWSRAKRRLDQRILEARRKVDPNAGPMEAWTLHDLRRSLATHAAEHGLAQPYIIEALLNHVSGHKGGIAGVYNKATYETAAAVAVQAWADYVLGADDSTSVVNISKKAS